MFYILVPILGQLLDSHITLAVIIDSLGYACPAFMESSIITYLLRLEE